MLPLAYGGLRAIGEGVCRDSAVRRLSGASGARAGRPSRVSDRHALGNVGIERFCWGWKAGVPD